MSEPTLDLDAMEARANAATTGPWHSCLGSGYHQCTGVGHDAGPGAFTLVADCLPDYAMREKVAPSNHVPNLKFIAHARTDVPALVAEVRRLRADAAAQERAVLDRVARMIETAYPTGPKSADARMIATAVRDMAPPAPEAIP